jgi:hypothetical protein
MEVALELSQQMPLPSANVLPMLIKPVDSCPLQAGLEIPLELPLASKKPAAFRIGRQPAIEVLDTKLVNNRAFPCGVRPVRGGCLKT